MYNVYQIMNHNIKFIFYDKAEIKIEEEKLK